MEIQKIRDGLITQPVEDIAERAADDQTESGSRQPVRRGPQPDQQPCHDYGSKCDETPPWHDPAQHNGPEYVSATLTIWAEKQGIALTYIQPGKPQQNAYVERYNRTVRHEWLDLYIFETIEEVQQIATEWLWTYNNERPNMGIGGVTPAMKLKMAA